MSSSITKYYTPFTYEIYGDNSEIHKVCVFPINKITKNLYLGDNNGAMSLNLLKDRGIDHIINCAAELPNYHTKRSNINYINLTLHDQKENIISPAKTAYIIIKNILNANPNAKIFIHCHMGKSRSASVLIYYLMNEFKISYSNALSIVQKLRPIVNPNPYYASQLEVYSEQEGYV